jgi:hypothetical protein
LPSKIGMARQICSIAPPSALSSGGILLRWQPAVKQRGRSARKARVGIPLTLVGGVAGDIAGLLGLCAIGL